MRRVVVTGIGMCTPLGYGVDINWKKLISSQSGIRKLEGFEIGDLNSKIGRQVPLEGNSNLYPENVLNSKDRRKIEPFIEFAMISAKEAIEDSGWLPESETDSQRAGVMVGSGIGGLDGIRMSSDNLRRSPRKISPFYLWRLHSNFPSCETKAHPDEATPTKELSSSVI